MENDWMQAEYPTAGGGCTSGMTVGPARARTYKTLTVGGVMSASILRKSGWVAAGLVVLIVGAYFAYRSMGSGALLPASAAVVAAPVGDLPNLPEKQPPASFTLDGCPPEGKGGDAELNLLKNRTDPGDYAIVSFDSLTTLTWPKNVERLAMAQWPEASRTFIEQY